MREIKAAQIAFFLTLLVLIVALVAGTLTVLAPWLSMLGEFRAIALCLLALLALYLYAFAVYRLFLKWMPLAEGVAGPGTRAEFVANVNILFYLLLFNSLIRSHMIPVPLLRLVYLALGAKLGRNTYSAGVLLDPPLTFIGSNTIIGHDAVIFAHVIEGDRLELQPVRIGDNVTIGATAIVMAGVTIGDGAIVSTGAVVIKDSRIGPDEIWGGMPARLLKHKAAR